MALQCIGLNRLPSVAHATTTENDDESVSGEVAKDFYEDNNYQLLPQSLDRGYNDFMTLVEYMEDHLKRSRANMHSEYLNSMKWEKKMKNQAVVSPYHTTISAQIRMIGISKALNPHTDVICTAIEAVISGCRIQVRNLYKRKSNKIGYEHRQTAAMIQAFKAARAPVEKALKELAELKNKQKQTAAAVAKAEKEVEELKNSSTSGKTKLKKAQEKLDGKREKLKTIDKRIPGVKTELQKQQRAYREEATKIFRKYQEYERARLDLTRDILLKFVRAMHSSEYSEKIDQVYDNLLAEIDGGQNTDKDLLLWEEKYGIDDERKAHRGKANVRRPKTEPCASTPETTTPSVRSDTTIDPEEQNTATKESTSSTLDEQSV